MGQEMECKIIDDFKISVLNLYFTKKFQGLICDIWKNVP